MAAQCPLIFRQVDATVTRINTLFVVIGVVLFLATHSLWIVLFLIGDFLLRLYGYKTISPTQNLSLWLQKRFQLASKMEDAGAKRLAALFGVGFMIALVVFEYLQVQWGVRITAGIYLACAGLDLLFGYCIACKIYHFVHKLYPGRMV